MTKQEALKAVEALKTLMIVHQLEIQEVEIYNTYSIILIVVKYTLIFVSSTPYFAVWSEKDSITNCL